jgi:glycosyltransferase involved in cell wall biosynthesis
VNARMNGRTNKVGINLLWMVPGVVGGSETYVTRLLSGLVERSTAFDYTLFALPQFKDAHPELAKTFKTAFAPVSGQWKSFRIAGENSWLIRECRRRHIDLVHHAGGVIPVLRTTRPVLTIHDLQYLYYPEYFTTSKLAYLKRIIPHGISPREPETPADGVREVYGLPERFFLYPAITYPHKNHLVLLEAFARLRRLKPETMLVFTGAKGSMETRIASEIHKLGIDASVKRLGYVPATHLDAMYRQAVAMCFPSRFEGFGAPVLEALARGCPVIAANATALPEVVGNAGQLVSPDNAEQWTRAMTAVLEDDSERERLAKAGIERSREFNWTRAADLLEDSYRHALETTL